MAGLPIPLPPTWVALPPEVNTARLMLGAGPAPMLQAAGGWEGLAILLETQADELAASLSNLQGLWSGTASERAVAATLPMIMWLRTTALQAQKRAMQATAQANSYSLALATTPPIPEIEQNHVTNAVLNATNFLGVNTVPIAVNEFDYFVRMWNQAAGAMDVYQAETSLNLLFEPIMPMKPIVLPGVGAASTAAGVARAAAGTPQAALRNGTVEMVSAGAKLQSARLRGGSAAAAGKEAAERSGGQVRHADNAQQGQAQTQMLQQGVQMGTQMASQVASLPQQFGQQVSSGIQQITQPLQQVTSMFSQMGAGSDKPMAQMGLIGASPFSNHPMAGGTGSSTGAGLVRAASLPGLGGTSPRTPLMTNLIGSTEVPTPVGAGAPGAGGAGLAPVGGSPGMGPMAGAGNHNKGGGSKQGLTAPAPLIQDLDEDEDDGW